MAQIAFQNQYSDIDFIYKLNPNTGDISTKKGINSVKQSVLNILRTNHGERPFNPYFGANLRSYLFENINYATAVIISNQVKNALANDEPRVKVLNVNVKTFPDRNDVQITVTIQIIATNTSVDVSTTLERLR
jgi:phage baseplate assembly protein W